MLFTIFYVRISRDVLSRRHELKECLDEIRSKRKFYDSPNGVKVLAKRSVLSCDTELAKNARKSQKTSAIGNFLDIE